MRPLLLAAVLLALALPVRAEDAPAPPPPPAFPAQQRLADALGRLSVVNTHRAALVREYEATLPGAEALVREIETLREVLRLTAPKPEEPTP